MGLHISDLFGYLGPYVPILILTYFLVTRTRTWFRLRHFQGPFLGKFTYAFMAKTAAQGKMNKVYLGLSQKYGPLVRIGPHDLITDDPDIVRMMSAARSPYTRSTWYHAIRINPYIDNVGSEMNVRRHDAIRAKMASAYYGKENPNVEADVDQCIAQLVDLIRTKYISTDQAKPMDFARKAQYLTLDVISKVAYGEEFGFLEHDSDRHDYIKTTDTLIPYLSFVAMIPPANALLNRGWVREKLGPTPDDQYGIGKLMGLARKVVSERFGENKVVKQDMLGAFVRNGIPEKQLEAEVIIQIIAGSDTTVTAIRGTFLYLLTHPRVLVKLRAELDDAERSGKISSPVTLAESKSLPYLQAVIKEGIRVHPPFTGLVSKQVPPDGDTIYGQYVPGGTKIAHNGWGLLRNKVFGDDIEVFRPERWLESDDKEHLMRMEHCLDLVFGYGRWGCLGKNIAWMELDKIFVELLRNFEFELMYPDRPWKSHNYGVFMQSDMWMRVTERVKV